MRKILAAVVGVAVALTIVGVASATTEPHKSYVCKYIGTPGPDEVLQSGQNPILVDNHALGGTDTVNVGDVFSDGQGFSVVLVANTDKLDPEPGTDQCPGGETPPPTPTSTPTPTPPPCEVDCPSPTPTPTPPPPPPPTPTPTPPPVSCEGSAVLGPWHGDPLVNVKLTGEGVFQIKGGILRRSGIRVVTRTLACAETFLVRRYHVMSGHEVRVYKDGVLVASAVAPFRVH